MINLKFETLKDKYKNHFLISLGFHAALFIVLFFHFQCGRHHSLQPAIHLHQNYAYKIIYANLTSLPISSATALQKHADKNFSKDESNKKNNEQKYVANNATQKTQQPINYMLSTANTGDKTSVELTRLMHDLIQSRLHYPRILDELQSNQQTYEVQLGFTLYPNGPIENIKILKSSGIKILDNEAQTTVASLPTNQFARKILHEKKYLEVSVIFKK